MYTPDERSLNAYKKAFEKKYSNIKLKYVIYPEKLRDQINVALQAHNPRGRGDSRGKGWKRVGRRPSPVL